MFKRSGTLFAVKKHSDEKYSDKWASLSFPPFWERKGNCIFNSLEESWRKYTRIVKYQKIDIVWQSICCSLYCFARNVVSETPQGTFHKFHRNFDTMYFPRESRITLSWGWIDMVCFHFIMNFLWPYILSYLCLPSPSAFRLLYNTL